MTEDELIERCRSLPERYAERVNDDDREGLQLMRDGGEWGELTSLLIAALAQHRAAITPAERDELRELAEATGEGRDWLDQLTVHAEE